MSDEKDLLDFQGSQWGRDDAPAFNPHTEPAKYPIGVLYQGPWSQPADGFNEHVRRCARALALTGCPVHLRGFTPLIHWGEGVEYAPEIKPLVKASIGAYSVQIHQMIVRENNLANFTTAPYLTQLGAVTLQPSEIEILNKFRVIYSVWERDRISKYIADMLNRVGQVWTACEANRAMLARSGVNPDKLRIVPMPFFDDDPLLALRGRVRKSGPPRFYHIGKWEPRKAQDQIIRAFIRAFRPGEAHLVMKIMTARVVFERFPVDPQAVITSELRNPDVIANGWTAANWTYGIEIVTKYLNQAEMMALHKFGDVYVSLSRAEGWDMPAFDAKLAGNLLVYTPSGGPQDFAGRGDIQVCQAGTVCCHPFYAWEPDAGYLDFDLEDAVASLRTAASRVRSPLDWRYSSDMSEFKAAHVGQRMLDHLKELVCPYNGKVF